MLYDDEGVVVDVTIVEKEFPLKQASMAKGLVRGAIMMLFIQTERVEFDVNVSRHNRRERLDVTNEDDILIFLNFIVQVKREWDVVWGGKSIMKSK